MNRHNTGNTSHHRVAPQHTSSTCVAWRQKQMKVAALPQTASTINTASLYGYLKLFNEKVSDDPGGKNLTLLCKLCPPGFKKQLRTSTTSTASLKQHTELKHQANLSRYVQVNKKSKDTAAKTNPLPPKSHYRRTVEAPLSSSPSRS